MTTRTLIEQSLARGDSPSRIAADLGVTYAEVTTVAKRLDRIASEADVRLRPRRVRA